MLIHFSNYFLKYAKKKGFDPWCESTRALQDLMQIERTTTDDSDSTKRNYLSQNQILNSNNLSNKNILSHIEFLQKQFDNPHSNLAGNTNINISNNNNSSILNENPNKNILNTLVNNNNSNNTTAKSSMPIQMPYSNTQVNTFLSQANELLSSPIKNLINSNQNLFNKRLAELNNLNQATFLNQDNSANANYQNFNDFLNNAKSNIAQAFLSNHTSINTTNNNGININNLNNNQSNSNTFNNRNQSVNLLRHAPNGVGGSAVIPPPGFGMANTNNFQTSSSSTSSSSSSASSSVDNSASSTPALNSNALPNNKSVPNSYSSTGNSNFSIFIKIMSIPLFALHSVEFKRVYKE